MADIRRRYTFYGNVQGVGFRFTAKYAARSLDLTGFVKNEWDGTVVMEVQGREALHYKLLERLNHDRYIEIDRYETEDLPLVEGERSFSSRY